MSKISSKDLKYYKEYDNFIEYNNQKALFKTKMTDYFKHNGEIVEVIGLIKGKDTFNDRFIVRFNDGSIDNNIMVNEVVFDFTELAKSKIKNKDHER